MGKFKTRYQNGTQSKQGWVRSIHRTGNGESVILKRVRLRVILIRRGEAGAVHVGSRCLSYIWVPSPQLPDSTFVTVTPTSSSSSMFSLKSPL